MTTVLTLALVVAACGLAALAARTGWSSAASSSNAALSATGTAGLKNFSQLVVMSCFAVASLNAAGDGVLLEPPEPPLLLHAASRPTLIAPAANTVATRLLLLMVLAIQDRPFVDSLWSIASGVRQIVQMSKGRLCRVVTRARGDRRA